MLSNHSASFVIEFSLELKPCGVPVMAYAFVNDSEPSIDNSNKSKVIDSRFLFIQTHSFINFVSFLPTDTNWYKFFCILVLISPLGAFT